MAIKWKKQGGSLKGYFIRFFFLAAVSVIAVSLIYVVFLGVGLYNGLLLPADTYANKVGQYKQTLESGGTIDLGNIPQEISYGIFGADGSVKSSTFDEEELAAVKALIKDGKEESLSPSYNTQRQMQMVKTGEAVYVFQYYMTAEFSSPVLRQIFPHVEWTLMLLMIVIILADIILVSVLFARRLSRKASHMKQAADRIKEGQLDFVVSDTGIKEFDSVMWSLGELKENLNRSLNSQWELQQQKKKQMGALAHDIKTPLTVIRGNTDLLLETGLDDEQREYLSYISDNVQRIQNYVTTLIEISKDEKEAFRPKKARVSEFIEDLERQFRPVLQGKALVLKTGCEIGDKMIPIDKELLMRALMNLVSNGVDYSPEGGNIYLEVWEDEDFVNFAVEDEGEGFSGEDLKYAAVEFYRAQQSRTMDGHYGMGLYIAKQIAGLHGGSLAIENGTRGARVTVSIRK